MARYAKEHKEDTRRRILEASSRRFKCDGVDGSGIAALMADAGLTNGAFYAHFSSKDDLIATVVSAELGTQRDAMAALPPGREYLGQLVREYLSVEHRDHPGEGCPSAALIEEICRGGDRVRAAYTDGIVSFVDMIAGRLEPRGAADPAGPRPCGVRRHGRNPADGPDCHRPPAIGRTSRAGDRQRARATRWNRRLTDVPSTTPPWGSNSRPFGTWAMRPDGIG